ncbi:MAG: NAD(P)H-dependent FMN reductase [Phycisphaerae bacterium]|nr:NAD(P)H-dependent FMN reductase [Phycisphaerae bacterium]
MAHTINIVALAGSTRPQSYNRKVLALAIQAAQQAGAQVTTIDLARLTLPLFDEQFEAEQGTPENARQLKQLMIAADGLLLASPEYNSSITPLLKNAIDWASRPAPGEPSLVAFKGKVAGLLAASPGALGGLRGLVHLRSILGNIGVIVLPDQVAIPKAMEAFQPDGSLVDSKLQAAVKNLAENLVQLVRKIKAT